MSVRKISHLLFASLCLLLLATFFLFHPISTANAQNPSDVIPGKFIVVLKDTISDPLPVADELGKKHGFSVEHVYKNALKGFSAALPETRLNQIKKDPRVQFVSEDRAVSITGKGNAKPTPTTSPTPPPSSSQLTPFGISRVGSNSANKGTGITVAVIDTGIDLTHPDLSANIIGGKNCSTGGSYQDGNGHGTHVAGTIAALDNTIGVVGVAPESKLLAVRVLNNTGSGTWSSVICGIDWVSANAAKYNIKVANMSLGGSGTSDNNCGNTNNDALHKAICNSRNAGVTYVVAAGNDGANANNFVPSAYDDSVITVSALADSDGQAGSLGSSTSYGADDTFANFSNYGSAVDIGAPGVNIYSTWKGGGYNTISGTSMATPHISGAAALYIKSHPGSTWSQVRDGLKASAEILNAGHTDPSGLHPEPVLQSSIL